MNDYAKLVTPTGISDSDHVPGCDSVKLSRTDGTVQRSKLTKIVTLH